MSKDTFLINFKIENGKLKPLNAIMHSRFNEMLRQSKPNSKIQGVFTVEVPDGTKAQLAKIHAMIGEIAKETGNTFDKTKEDIKLRCGLTEVIDGKTKFRSFANCSVETLSTVIEHIYVLGEFININFRSRYSS